MTSPTQEHAQDTVEPAPGELELVRLFVNTYDAEEDEEQLSSPNALAKWLRANGLDPGGSVTRADLESAIDVREALRSVLMSNNGEPADAAAAERLDKAAEAADLRVRFEPEGASATRPGKRGVAGALGSILAAVHAAMAEGTWERLKACPADDCKWAFYDRSRNRSRRWCDMEVCGNRAKVRHFRNQQGRVRATSSPE